MGRSVECDGCGEIYYRPPDDVEWGDDDFNANSEEERHMIPSCSICSSHFCAQCPESCMTWYGPCLKCSKACFHCDEEFRRRGDFIRCINCKSVSCEACLGSTLDDGEEEEEEGEEEEADGPRFSESRVMELHEGCREVEACVLCRPRGSSADPKLAEQSPPLKRTKTIVEMPETPEREAACKK